MGASLHGHSTFSKLDAYGTPEQIVIRALELGLTSIAITDHGNCGAHPKLEMAVNKWVMCKSCGKVVERGHSCTEFKIYKEIKPIYGVELYLNSKVTKLQKKQHITILAKDEQGYKNMLKLSSLAHDIEHSYYLPAVDLEDIYDHQDGLIVLSGCVSGKVSVEILKNDLIAAKEVLIDMNDNIINFFVEVQPLIFENSKRVNIEIIKLAKDMGYPIVATMDSHYIRPEDRGLQHFLAMVRRRTDYIEMPDFLDERCRLASESEMFEWMKEYGDDVAEEAIKNQDVISGMIENFKLAKAEMVKFPCEDPEINMIEAIRAGWIERDMKNNMKDTYKRYKDMIHHEVKVIKDKGYIDYFLVVADLVQYAKDKNIMVGPARGSAGASLVSYLMGITEVDPIEFDLLFERFLDPSRSDPPDIDLDFQDDRRDEVKEYLREKYGVDKVANVAGYTMFHEKSLIDDIGRCYKIPKSNITVYKDSLSINGGDNSITQVISEICGIYPQVPKNIHKILGQLRGLTVHAAGVIVSTKPIGETTTMMQDTIAIDKRDAGYMNLLKIDALSLKTLRVLSLCLERVEMSVKELYKLPLDIPEVLMGFKKGCMGGIFQYAGNTTKKVCMQALEEFKFDNNTKENMKEIFGVITDVNTLSRPASLNNGSTARYIKHDVEVIHPIITEHTQKTRGQIIYQEQIMRALRSAGLDWSDVTAVRKLMTAHEGAEKLSGIRDRFIENLIKMFGNTEEQALYVWRRLGDEGAYGFNAPHCVSYTKIAYYTMYFKIFHKDIFYWANMVVDPSDNLLLKEYIQTGGIVYPVRFGKSKLDWSLSDGQLRAGYITVKGIGVKSAEKLEKLTDPSNIAKGIRQKLEDIHAFDEDPPKPDYLGIGTMVKSLKLVNHRVPLKKVVNSENLLCSVGGRITELHIKSLIEFYKKDGRDWSKEKDAHKDKYVNFRMYDETEEMVCTINRYKYANPAMKLVVSEYETGDVVEIFGEWKKERGKMYISKIVNLTKMSETVL